MNNVLIATNPGDEDSLFVMHALKEKGCHPILWYPSDMPNQQYYTFKVNGESALSWRMRGEQDEAIERAAEAIANAARIVAAGTGLRDPTRPPADRAGDVWDGSLPWGDVDLYYRFQAAVPF